MPIIPLRASQCTIGDDELPMTMQVAMVGTDGIVLAGDMRHSLSPRFERAAATDAARRGYGATKIRIDEAGKIAICCAMDMMAARIFVDRVFLELPSIALKDRAKHIEEIGREVGEGLAGNREIESLIVFADCLSTFYRFRLMSNPREVCVDEVVDASAAGDVVNSAIFWRMHYYRRIPIANLIVLASHMIVVAGLRNSAMIEGLEIVLCDSEGFRRLSIEENREWQAKAIERDKHIGKLVIKP